MQCYSPCDHEMGAGKVFCHQVAPPSLIPSQKDALLTDGTCLTQVPSYLGMGQK